MFIDGIGIGGYRSFGELQRIGPFKKTNLFIGKNNSGKSNILSFIKNQLPEIHRKAYFNPIEPIQIEYQPKDFDLHRGQNSEFKLSFGILKEGEIYKTIVEDLKSRNFSGNEIQAFIKFFDLLLPREEEVLWLSSPPPFPTRELIQKLFSYFHKNTNEQRNYIKFGTKYTGRENLEDMILATLVLVAQHTINHGKRNIDLIPAIRNIGKPDSQKNGDDDFSGQGIIEELWKLQKPTIAEENKRERFQKINTFVQTVLRNKNVQIEIPYNKQTINVHIDGKLLPIENMGTGFHEATIIAAAATALTNQIICIEEPELHLHPLMEKELLRYLNEETENQYFITTHSNNLINTPESAIFHIKLENGQTTVTPAITDNQKFSICADLGYKASDLLQANCIIWAEGPSDRIYLNRWISTLDETLVEGLHYSIMFYGGKLLSHLSADDPEVEEFISLRKINRNISILIDSDKGGLGTQINKTKKRVRDEFDKGPGFAWVTKGREIENYIDPNLYLRAVKKVHPKAKKLLKTGKFDHAWYFSTGRGKPKPADKVKVAREVIKSPADLNRLDLDQNVKRLVQFIKASNGLEE